MFLSGARELGGFVSGLVHRRYDCHQRVVGLGQDASAFVHVVAVQPDHQRLVGVVAEDLQRLHDPIGNGVTRGDATEHVDEHALDLCVTQDDVETGGHHLGRGATTDVEEVRWLDPAVLLARVGHDIQRRHDQPGAVTDDADLAVELDVVEVVLLGLELQRVGGVAVLELCMTRLPEVSVAVERHLAVQRQDLVVGRPHQRVDLDQGGVLGDEDLPQLGDGDRRSVEHLGRQVALFGDRAGECHVDTLDRVHRDLGQPLGLGRRDLFDLYAALHRAHGEVGAVGAVEQEGDVVLLGDIAGLGDQQLLHDVALDVQAEDVLRVFVSVLGGGGVFDATGLAAAADLDLRFDHYRGADLGGDFLRALGGVGGSTGRGGDVVLYEQFFGLILEKIHGSTSSYRPVG